MSAVLNFTPLEEAQGFYSDFYKDLYGFRPRSATEEQWNSIEWLDAQIAGLHADAPRVAAEDASRDAAAVAAFEATVEKTVAAGARDRATAIRWLKDASGERSDDGFEYEHSLPFGYLRSAS